MIRGPRGNFTPYRAIYRWVNVDEKDPDLHQTTPSSFLSAEEVEAWLWHRIFYDVTCGDETCSGLASSSLTELVCRAQRLFENAT